MRTLLLLVPLLGSCAWGEIQRRAWRKDGACSVVCDWHQGMMSAALTLDPFTCRCMTPGIRDLEAHRQVPLQEANRDVHCCGTCVSEANAILARQPWRRQYPEPFDDPVGDLQR